LFLKAFFVLLWQLKTRIMKKPTIISAPIIAALFLLTACGDLFDVVENFYFEHEFHVTSSQQVINEFAVVDMSEKEDLIADYGSKIKKIEIQSVWYWLSEHTGSVDQKFNYLSLNVAKADGSESANIVNLQNVTLSELLSNPTGLSLNEAGIQKLNELIKNGPHRFSLSLNGETNEAPLNFKVVFEFQVKMTANPLN